MPKKTETRPRQVSGGQAKAQNSKMADLVEDYTKDIPLIKENETVKGKVVEIRDNQVLLDIGGMTTGVISGRELNDGLGTTDELKVGDEITATVIDLEDEDGQMVLSLRQAGREKLWETLKERMEKKEIFACSVAEANKGGLMVEVGGIKGFLPVSQLIPEHYPRVEGGNKEEILSLLQQFVDKKMDVVIINVDPQERKLILSEKEAVKDEQQKKLKKLKEGDAVEGEVSGVVDFGFFVRFDGMEGLVHISEISWDKVEHPSDYVKIGDKVKVSILGIEDDRVSLSMKRLTKDPWVEEAKKYKVGQRVKGKVTRITPFGAFVKLDDKVDGLVHISELSSKKVDNPEEILSAGNESEFKIISLEPEEHRLGLSLKALEEKSDKGDDGKKDEKDREKEKGESKKAKEDAQKSSKK
ncbi:S1 RNA-binding domain-containing protein [Patescibacteria group bacterium]|nr:MAG: S1 RNA-binding domain-containing protein [Patescibacteria group bacterium]